MHSVLTADMMEFNRLYKETDNIYTRYAASNGISTTALCVLYSLYVNTDPCTQTMLVDDWGIPMQTINSCLKAMEKSGDILLTFAEGSRKSKCILLTDQGRNTAEQIVAPLVEAENNALNGLADLERRQMFELTKKYNCLLLSSLHEKTQGAL